MKVEVTRVTPVGSYMTKRYELLVDGARSFQARRVDNRLILTRPRGRVSEHNSKTRPSEVEVDHDEWGALVRLVTGWFRGEKGFDGASIELIHQEGRQEEAELRMRDPATKIENLPLSHRVKNLLFREGFEHVSDVVKFLDAGGGPDFGKKTVRQIQAALVVKEEG